MKSTPEGIEDVSKLPEVFAALIESPDVTWTDEDLAKLANGNLLRAMREMELVRDSLADQVPGQDILPVGDWNPEETLCMSEVA